MDCREEFIREVNNSLITCFNPEDVNIILSKIILNLSDYDMSKKETSVGFQNNSSYKLLQLYAGCMLTEGKSKETVKNYIYLLKRFFAETNKDFVDVTTMDIRVWLADMQNKVSLVTCDNYRACLSSFYHWLEVEELIESNPMNRIHKIKYIDKKKFSFTDIQIDELRMSCEHVKNSIRDRAILELLLCSGVRVSELCALDISDIDFNKKQVVVRNGKGGKQRKVLITDLCLKYIKKYLNERKDSYEYLFITRNKTRITKGAVEDIFKKLGEISGIENVHPHRFRRTFATNFHKKGMDIRSIQKLMGHTNINTTMVYISDEDETIEHEFRKCS